MILNRKVSPHTLKGIKIFFSDVDGTLTDGCTYYSANGEEMKKFNHKDGRGNFLLRQNSIKFGIITGENTKIVEQRAKKLNANYCYLGVDNKFELIKSLCQSENISLNEIAFIGDDTNDLDLMKSVGISFAVNDAMPEVVNIAHVVCKRKGGDGAFREAVDYLIRAL